MDHRMPVRLTTATVLLGAIAALILIHMLAVVIHVLGGWQGQPVRAIVGLFEELGVIVVVFGAARRTWRQTRRLRLAWRLLGAAMTVFVIRKIAVELGAGVISQNPVIRSLGDISYLVTYVLVAASILMMITRPLSGRDRLYTLLDGLIVVLASLLAFSVLLFEPLATAASTLAPSTHTTALAASFANLFLLWIALTAMMREPAAERRPFQLIAASAALGAIGNACLTAQVFYPSVLSGALGELILSASLFALAVAAVGQMSHRPAPQEAAATDAMAGMEVKLAPHVRWARYLPIIFAEIALLMPVVYVSYHGQAPQDQTFLDLSVAVAVIIGLTLLRVGITLRDNFQLSNQLKLVATRHQQDAESLRRLKNELEQRVQDRMSDLLQVNEALTKEVAERRQAQTEVERQRAFLQQVIDLNPNRIFARDSEGRYILVNRALAEATGHAVSDMLNRTELDLNPSLPDAERFGSDDREVLRTQRDKVIAEELSTDRFGRPIWLYTVKRPIVDAAGHARQILGVSVDVTQRKHMEDRLRHNEQHLRMITDNIHDMVSQIDLNHVIQYASPSHRPILDYEPEQLMGRPLSDFLHPDEADAIRASLRELAAERTPQRQRMRIRHADGCWVWVEAVAKALCDEKGRPIGLIISARDNTATKQAEDALSDAHQELADAYQATLEGWMRALDLRDKVTEGHSQRVSELTVRLARAMNVAEDELDNIRRGALLHDIGKMGVPDVVLLKPGRFDEREMAAMRKHVDYAYDILWPISYLRPAIEIPYCHHERWDGAGYPRGLRGEQIPIAARIFAVVDVWDALLSHRPYRPAWMVHEVVNLIRTSAGAAFDPQVVRIFLDLLERGEIQAPAAVSANGVCGADGAGPLPLQQAALDAIQSD